MAKVSKITLTKEELLSLLKEKYPELLPSDVKAVTSYSFGGGDGLGLLVESNSFQNLEAGDLVYYAPKIELVAQVQEQETEKAVTAQGDVNKTKVSSSGSK